MTRAPRPRPSAPARALVLVGMLTAACSFENYGLDYTQVELRAERADGTPAARLPVPVCVTLPVLIGSVVEERRLIEDALGTSIRATSDRVEVRFFGAASPTPPRVATIDELEGGYRAEIDLQSRAGTPLTVVLGSPCSAGAERGP